MSDLIKIFVVFFVIHVVASVGARLGARSLTASRENDYAVLENGLKVVSFILDTPGRQIMGTSYGQKLKSFWSFSGTVFNSVLWGIILTEVWLRMTKARRRKKLKKEKRELKNAIKETTENMRKE